MSKCFLELKSETKKFESLQTAANYIIDKNLKPKEYTIYIESTGLSGFNLPK